MPVDVGTTINLTPAQARQMEEFEATRLANEAALAAAMAAFVKLNKEARSASQALFNELAAALGTTVEAIQAEGKNLHIDTVKLTATITERPKAQGGK